MITVSLQTALKDPMKYIDLAHYGEVVVVTKRGIPWAQIAPVAPAKKRKTSKSI